jgi:hypothetical protein
LEKSFFNDFQIELNHLKYLTEALTSIKEISKVLPSEKLEFRRIMNIWNLLNSNLLNKVKCEDYEWKYSREWYIFISKISNPIWMNTNYAQCWLKVGLEREEGLRS